MKPNVGTIDTVARSVLGAGAIFVSLSLHLWYLYPIGLLVMLSGIARYCPAYAVLGIDTCKEN